MISPHTDEELRREISKLIGQEIPDAVWSRVKQYRRDYFEGDINKAEDRLDDLRHEVENEIISWNAYRNDNSEVDPPPSSSKPLQESTSDRFRSKTTPLGLLRYTSAKSELKLTAVTLYFEQMANDHPEIIEARKRLIGDSLLSNEQARNLLSSHAARFLTPAEFHTRQVPVTNCYAKVVEPYRTSTDARGYKDSVTIRLAHSDDLLRLSYGWHEDESNENWIHRCSCMNGQVRAPYSIPLQSEMEREYREGSEEARKRGTNILPLGMAHLDSEMKPNAIWPGSLVDEIYEFSERIARICMWPSRQTVSQIPYRFEEPDASTMFFLTGFAPLVRHVWASTKPLKTFSSDLKAVSLNVALWADEDDLLRAFRGAKKHLLNRDVDWPTDKTLSAFCFIAIERRTNPERTWVELHRAWNREQKDRKYRFKSPSALSQSYERARNSLESLNYFVENEEHE